MKGSSTGNVTGIYDLSGGLWDLVAGYILNGSNQLTSNGINSNIGSSGGLMGATNEANPNGYQNLSTRTYTVYPCGNLNAEFYYNYQIYRELLDKSYGYGDAILEVMSTSGPWNSDFGVFAYENAPFFRRSGGSSSNAQAGLFTFYSAGADAYYYDSNRVILIAE